MRAPRPPPYFAELDCRTHYSFLEGASRPGELVMQAKMLGLKAVGVADRNSLAGIVRAWEEGEKQRLDVLTGARLQFTDGTELIVYPRDRAAYGRLCRLLSIGKAEIDKDTYAIKKAGERGFKPIGKGECKLAFAQAAELGEGLIALVPAPAEPDAAFEERLAAWGETWPDRLYLLVAPLYRGDDRARFNALAELGRRARAPLVASNGALYHHFERRRLQDVLTCVRHGVTIDEAGHRLPGQRRAPSEGPRGNGAPVPGARGRPGPHPRDRRGPRPSV